MSITNAGDETRRAMRRKRVRHRRRNAFLTGVIGVAGELLLTAGVGVLLFLGWQLWLNDAIVAGQQTNLAQELSDSWQHPADAAASPTRTATPSATPTPTPTPTVKPFAGEPPVLQTSLANANVFATLVVPRFGTDYVRTIAEGVGTEDVLNTLGVGHYPQSSKPGEPGNFALAAHRTAYGSSFEHLDLLNVGDSIYVETQDGWYRYLFRNHEMVTPSAVEVLLPVPRAAGAAPSERFITLTSCNPKHSTLERFIAYGVYDAWFPRSGGAPTEIAHLYKAAT